MQSKLNCPLTKFEEYFERHHWLYLEYNFAPNKEQRPLQADASRWAL